jgi:Rubisco Assembly chaperone C-terminal domain
MLLCSPFLLVLVLLFIVSAEGWVVPPAAKSIRSTTCRCGSLLRPEQRQQKLLSATRSPAVTSGGSLHGQDSCFLPLKQLEMDHYTPRIVQIAGAYPGLTRQQYFAVSSEPAAPQGQWSYDFSDANGPQLGTVALEGNSVVAECKDPVVIIAEHPSLGVQLPAEIDGAVDLVVLVDRAKNYFGERKFLVLDIPGEGLSIGAYHSKAELPTGSDIIGQVDLVQTPWLPAMAPTRTGFIEADEYF